MYDLNWVKKKQLSEVLMLENIKYDMKDRDTDPYKILYDIVDRCLNEYKLYLFIKDKYTEEVIFEYIKDEKYIIPVFHLKKYALSVYFIFEKGYKNKGIQHIFMNGKDGTVIDEAKEDIITYKKEMDNWILLYDQMTLGNTAAYSFTREELPEMLYKYPEMCIKHPYFKMMDLRYIYTNQYRYVLNNYGIEIGKVTYNKIDGYMLKFNKELGDMELGNWKTDWEIMNT